MDLVENSFLDNQVSLREIQRSIKHIPITLKLQLDDCFRDKASRFLMTEGVTELFFQLSFFWDYVNPGLLNFLVEKFGSEADKRSMREYLRNLDRFRASVNISEFIKATCNHTETSLHIHFRYKKIVTIMSSDWEHKTLQEVEQFKIEFCNGYHLPQSFLIKTHVEKSSIAIIFYFPDPIEVRLKEIRALFESKNVLKVYQEDWTKQVRNW